MDHFLIDFGFLVIGFSDWLSLLELINVCSVFMDSMNILEVVINYGRFLLVLVVLENVLVGLFNIFC